MSAFRFVHAADVHLDSPLRSLALRNAALAELVGDATRRALSRVVDLCLEERVDALLLAGDLYDGDQTSMKTARFLGAEIRRLHEAGIRVFVIRGNHDALSVITRTAELVFPDTVHVFGDAPDAIVVERTGSVPVVFHGLSFAKPHAPESLLARYRSRTADAINVGLLHTSLGGAEGHDPYSPCGVADLHATEFDYWALGHIHRRSLASADGSTVVMAGMPQGRDINEDGPKGVTLVTIGDDGAVRVEERHTCVAQFERVVVDASGATDWRGMAEAIELALGQARDRCVGDHLVARLRIVGSTPLAWRLRRDADLLKAEADGRADAVGSTWVEKLEVNVAPASEIAASGDPLVELRRLTEDEVVGSTSFAADLQAVVKELRAQLPPDCRDLLGASEAETAAIVDGLAREGVRDVLARMRAEG